MDKKMFSPFPIFFVATIVSVVFISLFTGCVIFGGAGKETPQMAVEPTEPAVSQAGTLPPLPAAMPKNKSRFQVDELDDEVKMVNGSLNWTKGVIRAKGYGIPPEDAVNAQHGKLLAFGIAHEEALAALVEITEGVHVTATTTVESYAKIDRTVTSKIEGVIRGAVEINREFKNQTAIIELGVFLEDVAASIPATSLPFDVETVFASWKPKEDETLKRLVSENEKLQNLVKETSGNLDEMKQKLQEMAEENKKLLDKDEKLLATIEKLNQEIEIIKTLEHGPTEPEQMYTGLVVNAAGSSVKRCMQPNIYYRSGDTYKLLYGTNDGIQKYSDSPVLAHWVKTLSSAQTHPNVTKDPFIIDAVGLEKEQSAIVISADDAEKIEKLNEIAQILEGCKVVIVY